MTGATLIRSGVDEHFIVSKNGLRMKVGETIARAKNSWCPLTPVSQVLDLLPEVWKVMEGPCRSSEDPLRKRPFLSIPQHFNISTQAPRSKELGASP